MKNILENSLRKTNFHQNDVTRVQIILFSQSLEKIIWNFDNSVCKGAENSMKWEKKARIIGIYSQFGNELVDLDNIWSRLILNANLLSTHHKKFTRKASSGQTNRGQIFF